MSDVREDEVTKAAGDIAKSLEELKATDSVKYLALLKVLSKLQSNTNELTKETIKEYEKILNK